MFLLRLPPARLSAFQTADSRSLKMRQKRMNSSTPMPSPKLVRQTLSSLQVASTLVQQQIQIDQCFTQKVIL